MVHSVSSSSTPCPVRHAFFSSAMRDREVEHVGRLLAVAALEPAQVSGRIRTDRVRPMAMRAILVEQAAPGSGPACVARKGSGRDGRIVRAHIRRRDRQTKEERSVYSPPRRSRQRPFGRGRYLAHGGNPAGCLLSSRRHSRTTQSANSKTNSAPPSGLEANIRSPVCPRKLGGVFSRPETTAMYCLPSSS